MNEPEKAATKYKVTGENNKILFLKNGNLVKIQTIRGLSITITGNNNTIIIHLPSKFIETSIIMNGDGNFCEIQATEHRYIRHTTLGMQDGSQIIIGKRVSVYRDLHVVSKMGCIIDIGNDCMFARDIILRNDDGHVITDSSTGEIINPPADIKICDNVWVATRAMILKDSYISEGSIVGAMALVCGKFDEPNIIIAGVPAKKIRGNITWDRKSFEEYCK